MKGLSMKEKLKEDEKRRLRYEYGKRQEEIESRVFCS